MRISDIICRLTIYVAIWNCQGTSTTFDYWISHVAQDDGKLDEVYGPPVSTLVLSHIWMTVFCLVWISSVSATAGRRDHRSGDLRDKLDRRYSPNRKYSPGRDARSHQAFHAQKPLSRDRGKHSFEHPILPFYILDSAALKVHIIWLVFKFTSFLLFSFVSPVIS